MKNFMRVILVMSVVWLGIFACTKHTDTNPASAIEKSANMGTPYMQASGSSTQFMTTSPTQVVIDQNDGYAKVELNNGNVMVEKTGEYLIVAAPQVGRVGTGLSGTVDFKCWLRVNGTDVGNSNVFMTLKPWTKDVIISQGIVSLNANDVVTVMMSASENDKGLAIEAIQPTGEPLVPSIIFTMYMIN